MKGAILPIRVDATLPNQRAPKCVFAWASTNTPTLMVQPSGPILTLAVGDQTSNLIIVVQFQVFIGGS